MDASDFKALEERDDSGRTLHEMMREERIRISELLRMKRRAERDGSWKYDVPVKVQRMRAIVSAKDGGADAFGERAVQRFGAKREQPLPRTPDICGWKGYDEKGSLYFCNNRRLLHPRLRTYLPNCGYHTHECVMQHATEGVKVSHWNEKALCSTHYVAEYGRAPRSWDSEIIVPGVVFVRSGTIRHPLAPRKKDHKAEAEKQKLQMEIADAAAEARENRDMKKIKSTSTTSSLFKDLRKWARGKAHSEELMHKAASFIQAHVRALFARRVMMRMKREVMMARRNKAATMVQNAFRRIVNQRKLKRMHLRMHDAAAVIQHAYRHAVWRRKLERDQTLRTAAARIQRWYRLQRAKYKLKILHIRQVARAKAKTVVAGMDMIRKLVRMWKMRRAIKKMRLRRKREHAAARKIQNAWLKRRGTDIRKEVIRQREDLINLMRLARKIIKNLQRWIAVGKARKARAKIIGAIRLLQRVARGFMGRAKARRRRKHIEAVWAWLAPTLPRTAFAEALGFPDYEVMFKDFLTDLRGRIEAARQAKEWEAAEKERKKREAMEVRRRRKKEAYDAAKARAAALGTPFKPEFPDPDAVTVATGGEGEAAGKPPAGPATGTGVAGAAPQAGASASPAKPSTRGDPAGRPSTSSAYPEFVVDDGELSEEDPDAEEAKNFVELRARMSRQEVAEKAHEALQNRKMEVELLRLEAEKKELAMKKVKEREIAAEAARQQRIEAQRKLTKAKYKKTYTIKGDNALIPMAREDSKKTDPVVAAVADIGLENTLRELAKADSKDALKGPQKEVDPTKARIEAFLTVLEASFRSQDRTSTGLVAVKTFERIVRAHGLTAPASMMRVLSDTFMSPAAGLVSYEAYVQFGRSLDAPCPVHGVLICPACIYVGPCDRCSCKRYMADASTPDRDTLDGKGGIPANLLNPHSTMCSCGHHKARHQAAMIQHPKVKLPGITNEITTKTVHKTGWGTQWHFHDTIGGAVAAITGAHDPTAAAKLTAGDPAALEHDRRDPSGRKEGRYVSDHIFAPQPGSLAPALAEVFAMKVLGGAGLEGEVTKDGRRGGGAPNLAEAQVNGQGATLSHDLDIGVGAPAFMASLQFTQGLGLTQAGVGGEVEAALHMSLSRRRDEGKRGKPRGTGEGNGAELVTVSRPQGAFLPNTTTITAVPSIMGGQSSSAAGGVQLLQIGASGPIAGSTATSGARPGTSGPGGSGRRSPTRGRTRTPSPSRQGSRSRSRQGSRSGTRGRPTSSSARLQEADTGTLLVPADALPSHGVYGELDRLLADYEASGLLAGSGVEAARRNRTADREKNRGRPAPDYAMGRTLEDLRMLNASLGTMAALASAQVEAGVNQVASSTAAALASASNREEQMAIVARGRSATSESDFRNPRTSLYGALLPDRAAPGTAASKRTGSSWGGNTTHGGQTEGFSVHNHMGDDDHGLSYDASGQLQLIVPRHTPLAKRRARSPLPHAYGAEKLRIEAARQAKQEEDDASRRPVLVPAVFVEALSTGAATAEGVLQPTAEVREAGLARGLLQQAGDHRKGTAGKQVRLHPVTGNMQVSSPSQASPTGKSANAPLQGVPRSPSFLRPSNPARGMFTYLYLLRALALPATDGYDLVGDPGRLTNLIMDNAVFLRERWADVVSDVRTGQLQGGPSGVLTQEQRVALSQMFRPSPGRAEFLENVFRAQGFHRAGANLRGRAAGRGSPSPQHRRGSSLGVHTQEMDDRHTMALLEKYSNARAGASAMPVHGTQAGGGRRGSVNQQAGGDTSGSHAEYQHALKLAAVLRSDIDDTGRAQERSTKRKVEVGASPYRAMPGAGPIASDALQAATEKARANHELKVKAAQAEVRAKQAQEEAWQSLGFPESHGALPMSMVPVPNRPAPAAGGGVAAARGNRRGSASGTMKEEERLVAVPAPPKGTQIPHPDGPFAVKGTVATSPLLAGRSEGVVTFDPDGSESFNFFKVAGPRPFACRHPACGASFGTVAAAVRHTQSMHGGAMPLITTTENDAYLAASWKAAGMDARGWVGGVPRNAIDRKADEAVKAIQAAEREEAEARERKRALAMGVSPQELKRKARAAAEARSKAEAEASRTAAANRKGATTLVMPGGYRPITSG